MRRNKNRVIVSYFVEKIKFLRTFLFVEVKKLTITGKKCHTICTSVPFLNESKKEGLREATLQAFFWRKKHFGLEKTFDFKKVYV